MDKVFYHQALNSPIDHFMNPVPLAQLSWPLQPCVPEGWAKPREGAVAALGSAGVPSWAHPAQVCPALCLVQPRPVLCASLLRLPAGLVLWPNLLLTPPPQGTLLVVCDPFVLAILSRTNVSDD